MPVCNIKSQRQREGWRTQRWFEGWEKGRRTNELHISELTADGSRGRRRKSQLWTCTASLSALPSLDGAGCSPVAPWVGHGGNGRLGRNWASLTQPGAGAAFSSAPQNCCSLLGSTGQLSEVQGGKLLPHGRGRVPFHSLSTVWPHRHQGKVWRTFPGVCDAIPLSSGSP